MNPLRGAWLVAWALLGGTSVWAAPLPYQTPDQHLGVASCASSVCHGSVTPSASSRVRLDEYITWSHRDAHAKAYESLVGERGRAIAARLGLPSAQAARICLDCHADNVPPERRGPRFVLADGVGCEACHGGAERWIASHVSDKATYHDDLDRGMFPSANLAERAQLCESCHVGNRDKLATHRIMGAGHPRLAFELDTYLALEPPHYAIDGDYQKRKPVYRHAQTWVSGQLQAALLQLGLVQDPRVFDAGVFPELALFNCAACHDSSMRKPVWHRQAMTELTAPGMVPLNDAYLRMAWAIARALDPQASAQLLVQAQALQKAIMTSREQVAVEASKVAASVQLLQTRALREPLTRPEIMALLGAILQIGGDGGFCDYLGAEQAVMTVELLLIDLNQAARLRPQLNELYRLVSDDEKFRAADLQAALRTLRGLIDPSPTMNQ